MTRDELIQKLLDLSDAGFAKIAPLIEANLDAVDGLAGLQEEIEAGRRSAASEPTLEAAAVYARVRQALSD